MKINIVLIVSLLLLAGAQPSRAQSPDPDTYIGRWGVAEEKKYHAEQEERAKKVIETIDGESVKHHPYYEGTDIATVIKNNMYDIEVIEHPETYEECLDYKVIGSCLTIKDGNAVITPYVRYYGPWQKGEEVPEAFRTGYLPKELVKPIKESLLETYYSEFMPDVIKHQIDYSLGVTIPYLNKRSENPLAEPSPAPTPDQEVLDAVKEVAKSVDGQLGEASMDRDGFVYNEYHLFPAKSSLYAEMQPPEADFYGWCHTQKFPLLWMSELPGMNIFSRYSEQSQMAFPAEMSILRNDPLNCIGFNIMKGVTPANLSGLSLTSLASPCQGVNQGAWLPVLNKVASAYQTTAAAIGLTRSRIANRVMPMMFYDIDPKEDKVQWIQNDRMDGPAATGGGGATAAALSALAAVKAPGSDVKPKKCSKLEKFVLEYERGNLKIGPEEGKDHWNVLAHWRKIRCCPLTGVPIVVTVPGETLIPILE